MHPKEAKLKLAESITAQYHGLKLAKKEKEDFQRVFSQRVLPEDTTVYKLKTKNMSIIEILMDSGLTRSKNEARRLIREGAVSLDTVKLDKEDAVISKEGILKVGKRRFLRLKI